MPINITTELKVAFDSVSKALINACELALKRPLPKESCFDDRCMHQEFRLSLKDRRQPRTKNPIYEENLCACGVLNKNFYSGAAENLNPVGKTHGIVHDIS